MLALVLALSLSLQPLDFLQIVRFGDRTDCGSSCCQTAQSGGAAAQSCCDLQCKHPSGFAMTNGSLPLPPSPELAGATISESTPIEPSVDPPASIARGAPLFLRLHSLLI